MILIDKNSLYGCWSRFFSNKCKKWKSGEKCGNISFGQKEIVAKPVFNKRSEYRIMQDHMPESLVKYRFSFNLSDNFSKEKTIILQFHDYWNVPDDVLTNRTFLYMATSPPVAFFVQKKSLFLEQNELRGNPFYDYKNGWLSILDRKLTKIHIMDLKANSWIDLEIEVFWSLKKVGYINCNGVNLIKNISTLFNENPCNIQCGLYMGTNFEFIKIREIEIC